MRNRWMSRGIAHVWAVGALLIPATALAHPGHGLGVGAGHLFSDPLHAAPLGLALAGAIWAGIRTRRARRSRAAVRHS